MDVTIKVTEGSRVTVAPGVSGTVKDAVDQQRVTVEWDDGLTTRMRADALTVLPVRATRRGEGGRVTIDGDLRALNHQALSQFVIQIEPGPGHVPSVLPLPMVAQSMRAADALIEALQKAKKEADD